MHCYSAGELQDGEAPAHFISRSLRWDHYVPVQLVPQLERLQDEARRRRRRRHHRERACPALQLRAGLRSEPNERSISPWRYRWVPGEDKNRKTGWERGKSNHEVGTGAVLGLRDAEGAPACSIDEDENRYPRKLAFAECLCDGCVDVKTGRETTSLNSVAIHQTMMVLRRKPCPRPSGPGLVTFEVDYIKVPVGCTCVLPRTGR